MHDNFRVGLRTNPVTPALELIAEGLEVVDLPVVDDPDGPVLVRDRLVAGLEIDDAQPAHAERRVVVVIGALVIRSAMPEGSGHPLQRAASVRHASIGQKPRNPTHDARSTWRHPRRLGLRVPPVDDRKRCGGWYPAEGGAGGGGGWPPPAGQQSRR